MTPETPRRRWLRFSLRTLFVLLTVAGIALGYVAWRVNVVRNQRQVLAEIQKLNASISFVHNVTPPRLPPGPPWLRRILGEDFFYEVDQIAIFNDRATDDTLARIASLSRCDSLIVRSNQITDVGMKHLLRIRKMRSLEIESPRVTVAGFERLRDFPVEALHLRGANVDDTWMPQIARLRHVLYLSIRRTNVTDAGLAELRTATGLRRIFTNIQGDGVEELKKALPNCQLLP
jgi:hypothetical protein